MSNIFTNIRSVELVYSASALEYPEGDRVLNEITLEYHKTFLDKLFGRPAKHIIFTLVNKTWRTGINYRKVTDDEFALIQRCIEHGITALNV